MQTVIQHGPLDSFHATIPLIRAILYFLQSRQTPVISSTVREEKSIRGNHRVIIAQDSLRICFRTVICCALPTLLKKQWGISAAGGLPVKLNELGGMVLLNGLGNFPQQPTSHTMTSNRCQTETFSPSRGKTRQRKRHSKREETPP